MAWLPSGGTRRLWWTFVLLVGPMVVGGAWLAAGERDDSGRLFGEIVRRIATDGVDSVRQDSLYLRATRALINSLNDPYAELFSPGELASFSRNTLGDAYGGVGMQLEDQAGTVIVTRVFPNTPAETAGVQPGDRLVSVDGVATHGLPLEVVSKRLVGSPGSPVSVGFAHPGALDPVVIRLTRRLVRVPAIPFTLVLDRNVGYIPLQRFNETAGEELAHALHRLTREGARAFILDLRGNPGGSLDQSLVVSDLFLPPGQEIATVRYRNLPPARFVDHETAIVTSDPIVVLIDEFSASASEIVAGALQDHDRALIIGRPSYGKGLVQTLFRLDHGWALKITTGKWYTPCGRSIQRDRPLSVQASIPAGGSAALDPDFPRPIFHSDRGRPLLGGGGVIPDVLVAADTLSTSERAFIAALGAASQRSLAVLYDLALELKPQARPGFVVKPEWREAWFERLRMAGAPVTREQFEAAQPLVDRAMEQRIASLASGDSGAFRRSVRWQKEIRLALALLTQAPTQNDLLRLSDGG